MRDTLLAIACWAVFVVAFSVGDASNARLVIQGWPAWTSAAWWATLMVAVPAGCVLLLMVVTWVVTDRFELPDDGEML